VAYEYWINDLYDQKYSGSIDNEKSFVLTETLDCSVATKATNTLYFRFKDATGKWSSVLSQHFYRPVEVGFSTIVGLSEATFTNTTKYADRYEWDFGDGNTSNQVNPMHEYAEPGAYLVRLIARNGGFTDSLKQYVEVAGIRTISSNRGGNGGVATVIFFGGGLTANTQVIITERKWTNSRRKYSTRCSRKIGSRI
jgi:PKD repeat protein